MIPSTTITLAGTRHRPWRQRQTVEGTTPSARAVAVSAWGESPAASIAARKGAGLCTGGKPDGVGLGFSKRARVVGMGHVANDAAFSDWRPANHPLVVPHEHQPGAEFLECAHRRVSWVGGLGAEVAEAGQRRHPIVIAGLRGCGQLHSAICVGSDDQGFADCRCLDGDQFVVRGLDGEGGHVRCSVLMPRPYSRALCTSMGIWKYYENNSGGWDGVDCATN